MGETEARTPEESEQAARERRIYPRTHCWGTTWLHILPEGPRIIGYLLNFGLGGCHLDTDSAIQAEVGDRVEVYLELDGAKLLLAGMIVHMEEGNLRVGIEFTDVSERKAEQIQRMMAAILEAEQERQAGVEELGG